MQNSKAKMIFSGLSGLQMPIPKYLYPPPFENSSRLAYYSSFFNSIEINSSFYKIPQATTVAKWAGLVPENFKFTFKLWKEITHTKNLTFKIEDVSTFFKSINEVKEKKGCLLIQFPPSLSVKFRAEVEHLLNSINELDQESKWKIAIEFRNKSWYQESIYNLVEYFEAAIVIQDIPKSATPLLTHNSDFVYVRFHGPTGNYRDSYSEDFLNEYATYINDWNSAGKVVYMYFNNTLGEAFNNLVTLNNFLKQSSSGISY